MVQKERFADFFEAIHGHQPFPWQKRLVDEIISSGTWPKDIELPTGAGKTAVIDVAVFALACGASIPRRTVMIVDRRLVVDASYERAKAIASQLNDTSRTQSDIVRAVADALAARGGDPPLQVVRLRGGMYREPAWAKSPVQPMVICSTIDQVGSRILHQGYGVSPAMRPVQAGLLSNDTLLVLDEAHISEPFRQTVEWITVLREAAERKLALPFGFVKMSATPGRNSSEAFTLDAADSGDPVLRRRLETRKQVRMHGVKRARLDKSLAESAVENSGAGRTTLVVVNRVARARSVARMIGDLFEKRNEAVDIVVLTGRLRPVDRNTELERVGHRLFAGRSRKATPLSPPVVLVATQTVEVGADIDADALVTEACPLDALIQRAGRLDRLGELGESSVVVVGETALDEKPAEMLWEPVYGTKTAETWKWLRHRLSDGAYGLHLGRILSDGDPGEMAQLTAERPDAPVLFPAYCDLWVQTRPPGDVAPAPKLFLHGSEEAEPDVQLVWRSDLREDDPDTWVDTVSVCPPWSGEALPLRLSTARRWLRGEDSKEGSDLESGSSEQEENARADGPQAALFLLWRGASEAQVTGDADSIHPGDTIVVPAAFGGTDRWGWSGTAPGQGPPSADVAEEARARTEAPMIMRLHPAVTLSDQAIIPSGAEVEQQEASEFREKIVTLLRSISADASASEGIREGVSRLLENGFDILPHPSGTGWVLSETASGSSRWRWSTEADMPDENKGPVALEGHSQRVADMATDFAQSAGLPAEVSEDVRLAALFHDAGKADPRFQALLHGGDRFRAARSGLIAKSLARPATREYADAVRERSGYPKGGRHELLSLRLVESNDAIREQSHDWELVRHLLASHHGWCRPLAPPVEDGRPQRVSVDLHGFSMNASSDCHDADGLPPSDIASGIADRFFTMARRYGWWGLSYLEAMVRLADQRVSELEEREIGS